MASFEHLSLNFEKRGLVMSRERLCAECIGCLLRKHVEKYPEGATEEQKLACLQAILKSLSEAPSSYSGPIMMRDIEAIRAGFFGASSSGYAEIKKHYNGVMLEREESVREKVKAADEKLKLAIQYAMTGNYIYFGAMKDVDENYLTELLDKAYEANVSEKQYAALKSDLAKAQKLVYLTDNCGEVVMDKILIETIKELYPQIDITVIVRGKEIVNDVTMEDATQVGLTDIVKVIGNGSDVAGTFLEEISSEALAEINAADVIMAKGQGNYETLRGCGKNIYYMFLCKCDLFANVFNVPRFTAMLVNDITGVL